MIFTEIIAVYSENRVKFVNILCAKNVAFYAKEVGTCMGRRD